MVYDTEFKEEIEKLKSSRDNSMSQGNNDTFLELLFSIDKTLKKILKKP